MSLSQAFAQQNHAPKQQERDSFCLEKAAPAGMQFFDVTPTSWRESDETVIIRTSPYTAANAFENIHEYAMAAARTSDADGRPLRSIVVMQEQNETVYMSDSAIVNHVQTARQLSHGCIFAKTA